MESSQLQQLNQDDILQLYNFYQNHKNSAPQVWNFLHCILKWEKSKSKNIKIYSPEGKLCPEGTFVAILQFNCYEIFMHTMEKSCQKLTNALKNTKNTKILQWKTKSDAIIYALHGDLQKPIIAVLRELNIPICFVQDNALWIHPLENIEDKSKITLGNSMEFQEFFLAPLNTNHANVINDIWPYRYKDSEKYIQTIIENNGGLGVFHKVAKSEASEPELVAWTLKNGIGMLGFVQTKSNYKKIGLASCVVKAMSKQMAAEGFLPMCTIATGNEASQRTFSKCGFRFFAKCCYIGIGTETSMAFDGVKNSINKSKL